MTMQETVLAHATLILPDRLMKGHVVIRDGVIAEIGEGTAPRSAQDCDGAHIAPGLIELHTDNLERHIQPRPGVDWPHAAAIYAHDAELAGCGITTVFDAMRVGSIPDRKDYAPYARQLATELLAQVDAGNLRISHHLHLRAEICCESLLEELASFGPGDRVGLVSLMDHTPGQRQFRDTSAFRTYLRSKVQLTDDQIDAYFAQLREMSARNGAAHEAGTVAFAGRMGAVLASHDDSTAGEVGRSAAHGIRLAEFPTTREAAEECRRHSIRTIMGAPNLIRGARIPAMSRRANWPRPGFWISSVPTMCPRRCSRRRRCWPISGATGRAPWLASPRPPPPPQVWPTGAGCSRVCAPI